MAHDGADVAFTKARHLVLFDASCVAAVKLNPAFLLMSMMLKDVLFHCLQLHLARLVSQHLNPFCWYGWNNVTSCYQCSFSTSTRNQFSPAPSCLSFRLSMTLSAKTYNTTFQRLTVSCLFVNINQKMSNCTESWLFVNLNLRKSHSLAMVLQ